MANSSLSATVISEMLTSNKLNGTNYDIWHRKVQYLLNERGVIKHISSAMVALDEPSQNASTEQLASYKAKKDAFDEWSEKDRSARYAILASMHDDLIGQFEVYPTAKDMWDNLKDTFGKTSATRLRTLHLSWLQYKIDSSRSVPEHIRAMSAMLRDLGAGGIEISEYEQVNNVIRSLPDNDDRWSPFKALMSHNVNLKSFTEIARHVEMQDERLRALTPLPVAVALVAKGGNSNRNNQKRKPFKKS
ncbi:unnamed protein product [Amaranthus hypochondriacus]